MWVKSDSHTSSGRSAEKSRRTRSGAATGARPGRVVTCAFPLQQPAIPCARMRRSTVQRATVVPSSLSSSHILSWP
jgi:hypothetical protein